ncbi:MAG: hypothetical protein P8Y96_03115 [Desulfuromonadales bacterium]|jgi:hypothetical protein
MVKGILGLSVLLLGALLLSDVSCWAVQDETEPTVAPSLIDRTHQAISQRLAAPSIWFDHFFQDPRVDEEAAGTFIRLRGSLIVEESAGVSFDGKIKARLRLPNLNRRFHLIFSSDEDRRRDKYLVDPSLEGQPTKEKTTVALEYTQTSRRQLNLSHRLRLDWDHGPNPQLRSRVRYSMPVAGSTLLVLTQAVFWENQEGFGEETRIDYDIPMDATRLVRLTGNGFFSESSQGYEWLGMVQWLQSFSRQRALAVGSYAIGQTRPQEEVTEYDLFARYRRQVAKPWLFIELTPELRWRREDDFNATALFTLTLEVQFGK